MPKLQVIKEIKINASASKVFSAINKLDKWNSWSPWLVLEPEVKVKTSEDKKFQEWDGKRIGAGNIRIVKEEENTHIACDLTFLKPWKSKAKVYFDLVEKGGETQVNWRMDSSLPFYLFWMKKTTIVMIGMDFDRGLTMLKEYVEKGKVNCQLDFQGTVDFTGFSYVGIERETSIAAMPQDMSKDFETLENFLEKNTALKVESGKCFSQYHKWSFTKEKLRYTAGFQVNSKPENLPPNMKYGTLEDSEVYSIKLTGSYSYLGNAWSAIMSVARSKMIKPNKKYHPFELYITHPKETPDEELITEINMPIATPKI